MAVVKRVVSKLYPESGEYHFIVPVLQEIAVSMSTVHLDPNNPRRNDEAAVRLAELIRQNGFRVPIITDSDGRIVAGNTRWKAMRLLGAERIPAMKQEFASEQARIAFGMSDNKSSEWAMWDDEVLARLIADPGFKPLAGATGFNEAELRGILMEPDLGRLDKLKEDSSGMKAKIVIVTCDAQQAEVVRGMLRKWIAANNLNGLEVK